MRKILQLIKIQIKNSSLYEKLDHSNMISMIIILILTSLFLIVILTGENIIKFYDQIYIMGLEEYFFELVLMVLFSILLVYGLFHIVNLFYFSKDIERLLPLPLRPVHILVSKILGVLVTQYIIYFIGFSTVMILYGLKHNPGVMFYLNGLLLVFFLPVSPLIVISLFCFVIMRFVNISRYKELVKIITYLALLIVPFLIRRIINLTTLKQSNFISEYVFYLIRQSFFEFQNPAYTVLIVSITLFFVLLFILSGEALYFKGVVGNSESFERINPKESVEVKRLTPAYAYILNELRSYIRTPVFLIHCIIKNSLWPVLVIVVLWSQGSSLLNQIPVIQDLITSHDGRIVYIIFAVVHLQLGQNYSAAISFSKDGSQIMVSKYIPVEFVKQIMYRVYASAIVLAIPSLILLMMILWLFNIPLDLSILAFLLSIFPTLFGAMLGVIMDLYNPKFHWDSEARLIKSNWNIVCVNIIAICISAIFIFIAFRGNSGFITALIVCVGVSCLANLIMYLFIKKRGASKFHKMLDC